MKYLTTPEHRFQQLKDYPFEPNYVCIGGAEAPEMRMHYVDAGPVQADPILMLHGEPSWSYLYRHMIPPCAAAGHRVIVPDLIGFGRSDKPASIGDYSYSRHVRWLLRCLDALELKNITLVCQDWGAMLGLRLAAENTERFKAIVVGNGLLPTGDERFPRLFYAWRAFARFSPWFPVAKIIDYGTLRALDPEELRAYEAPFPGREYTAGARAFPRLVPTTSDNPASEANRKAWRTLERWEKPFLTTFSHADPITRGGDRMMQNRVPGAADQPHQTLRGGHFLQQDAPREFARAVLDLLARLKSGSGRAPASVG